MKTNKTNVAQYHQEKIARDTVKNPNKAFLGGPSADASETFLRSIGYTDKEIQKLKG